MQPHGDEVDDRLSRNAACPDESRLAELLSILILNHDMRNEPEIPRCVLALIESLTLKLGTAGFELDPHPVETDPHHRVGWIRRKDWREDHVELSWDRHQPDSLLAQVIVNLVGKDQKWSMDGTTVHYVAGRAAPRYFFPGELAKLLGGTQLFVSKVTKDTVAALRWFELFKTPAACIDRLHSGQANFSAAGSEAYETVMRELRRLRDESNPDA